MSYPQDGRDMDDRPSTGGSVKRARERAMAGLPREDFGKGPMPPSGLPVASQATSPPRPSPRNVRPKGESAMAAPAQPAPAPSSTSRIPRPQAPPGLQGRDGQIGVAISRPTQVPQWPLAGPVAPPVASATDPGFKPGPGRGQAPQRPPRPSRVPSILDGSKIQDPTPFFQQYAPQPVRDSELSIPQTASSTSRPSTIDSVGSIPDFPLPVSAAPQPPPPPAPPAAVAGRRSVNLGPPPSARRGASSFYSNASYVSPIPEESPRSRSHASYASSAAMPGSFGSASPGPSPQYPEAFYDDVIREESSRESVYEDERGDESQLVRSASVGKRGKALLVTTPAYQRTSEVPEMGGGSTVGVASAAAGAGMAMDRGLDFRPSPTPVQPPPPGPFQSGTGYVDTTSSSSSSVPKARTPATRNAPTFGAAAGVGAGVGTALTADAILNAYDAASSTDPDSSNRRSSISPPTRSYSRLSAIRRPPRLDIDAVKAAESRGSLTSLPDLIRRATRLAASLEKGRRPASRFDELDYYGAAGGGRDGARDTEDFEKHQSGLSDMLAAFPPPAQPAPGTRRSMRPSSLRQSIRNSVSSWPLPVPFNNNQRPRQNSPLSGDESTSNDEKGGGQDEKPKRRCCGMPLWVFILVMIVIAAIITAAVVVPIEFFVIRRGNSGNASAQPAIAQCQAQLTCANGGTNIVSAQGTCSCICTNGFTGQNCTIPGSTGCTTTNIEDQSSNVASNLISNVTLGEALPRLIQGSQTNFSIPLSVTQILAKLNTASLSCVAQNALVTFDGQSSRVGEASAEVVDATAGSVRAASAAGGGNSNSNVQVVNGVAIEVVTVVMNGGGTTTVLRRVKRQQQLTTATSDGNSGAVVNNAGGYTSTLTIPTTFQQTTTPATTTTTVTTTITSTSSSSRSPPLATFTVTEEVVDFARVGVLLILQQESLGNAETAQGLIQKFFTSATAGRSGGGSGGGQGGQGQGVTIDAARNLTLQNGNTINLVNFQIDVGAGVVGRGIPISASAARLKARSPGPAGLAEKSPSCAQPLFSSWLFRQ